MTTFFTIPSKSLKTRCRLAQHHLRRALAVIAVSLAILPGKSIAQTISNYGFVASSGVYTPIVGTTLLVPVPATLTCVDDNTVTNLPIGFPFTYRGIQYTTISVSANGFIRMGGSVSNSYTGLSAQTDVIAPLNNDLYSCAGTSLVSYAVSGSSPNRVFTLQWKSWGYYNTGNAEISFQIRLIEGSNNVQFVYDPGTPSTDVINNTQLLRYNGVGLNGASVSDFKNLATTTTWSAPTISGTNTNAMAFSPTIFPASGQTYTFAPPAPCVQPAPPTAINLVSVSTTNITGSFTAATPAPAGYVVVRTLAGSPAPNPTNGNVYVAGQQIGNGTVLSVGTSTTFSATGLSGGTAYDFYVFSYSTGTACSISYQTATPLVGTQTTQACAIAPGVITIGPLPAQYQSLSAALALMPGCFTGSFILELQSGYTTAGETFPIAIPFFNGMSASNTLTIRPAAGAGPLNIASANATATFNINGGRFVTIDGRPGGTGSNKNLLISNTATSGVAVQMINDAQNNTLTYCDLTGQNTNTATSTTAAGVIFIGAANTTTLAGNDKNTISNCNVHAVSATSTPSVGIYSIGSTTTIGAYNDSCVITDCNIYDFFLASAASSGVKIFTGTNAWTISKNNLYQTVNPRTTTATATHRGLWITPNTGTISNTASGFLVTDNFIGGSVPGAGGSPWTVNGAFANVVQGMDLSMGLSTPTSVQNNVINNFAVSTTTGNGFVGIGQANGNVNIGTVTGNVIGTGTATGGVTVLTTASGGGTAAGLIIGGGTGSIINAINNNIGGITSIGTTTLGVSITGIAVSGGATINVSANTVGSATVAQSIQASSGTTGIQNVAGILVSGGTTVLVRNNLVANLYNAFSPATATTNLAMRGIGITGGTTDTIQGNTVRNLSAPTNFSPTATGVTGILSSNTATATNINSNNVYSLEGIGVTGMVTGIANSASSGTHNIYNNFVSGLTANSNTAAYSPINGIQATGAGTTNLYNNTIYIGNGSPISGVGASGIQFQNATGGNLIRNNIINVDVTASSGNNVAVIRRAVPGTAGTAPTLAVFNANNNVYYTPSSPFNFLYVQGTVNTTLVNGYATSGLIPNPTNNIVNDPAFNTGCSLYKLFMLNTGRESATFTENNLTSGATPGTFAPTGLSYAEGGGVTTTPAVIRDFAGVVRGTVPDMGALEFAGIKTDAVAPIITYTALPVATTCAPAPTLTASISDPAGTGVNVAPGLAPRLYYRKASDANAFGNYPGDNTSAFNGWKYVQGTGTGGTFSFTPDYNLLTAPLATGDSIQYFVVAQDSAGTPNVAVNQAGFASGFCATSVNLTPAAGPVSPTPVVRGYRYTAFPAQTATASSNSVCAGGSTTLDVNPGVTGVTFAYSWSNGTSVVSTAKSFSASPMSTTTYTVTVSDNCTIPNTGMAAVTVTVNPLPVIVVTPSSASTCGNASVMLVATGAPTITWAPPAPGAYCIPVQTGSAVITNVTLNSLNNTTAAGGVSPYYVNFAPTGTQTTTLVAGSANTLSVTLDAAGIVSAWIDYNRDGVLAATEWVQVYTAATTGSVTVNVPASAGNGLTRMRIRSRLSGNPNGSGDACTGFGSGEAEDYTITITGGVDQGGLFLDSLATIPYIPNSNEDTVWARPPSVTTYIVTGTSALGCIGTATVTVTPNPLPTVTATASPAAICPGSSSTLTATGSAGATYVWSPAVGLSSTTGATVTAMPASTTTYTVTATSTAGCTASNSVTVTVGVPTPLSVAPSASSPTICTGGSTILSANASGGCAPLTYVWTVGTNTVSTAASFTVSPSAPTTYTVTVTDAAANSATGSVSITINPVPVITVTPVPAYICSGSSVLLTADGASSFMWTGLPAGYCIPTVGFPNDFDDVIQNFSFANITNNGSGAVAGKYSNFTNLIANVVAGSTYPVSLAPGAGAATNFAEGFRVWIDTNRDGTFSNAESVFTGGPVTFPASITSTLTVPAGSRNGLTRMRVAVNYNAIPGAGTACGLGSSSFGEFEDYSVLITGGVTVASTIDGLFLDSLATMPYMGSNTATVWAKPATSTPFAVSGTSSLGCTGTAQVSVSVFASGLWLGITSTDWFTGSNWCGGVPTVTTDVVIPPTAPFMPTLTAPTTIGSFINNGQMTVSPTGVLNIN